MKYGLLGETLKHSYSKIIHEQLADYTYDLVPVARSEFDSFMKKREFDAINVTIPYKEAVISYLDEMDEQATKIQAVNTIVNENGKLIGHNTDFDGFLYTIQKHQIAIKGKKVMVIGFGGASKAILAVLRHLHADRIIVVNRTKYPETITFEDAYRYHSDADVIINTTSVGMYPNIQTSPLCLNTFKHCKAVIDIIYNPLQTKLLLDAMSFGMKAVNGLDMLVAQAKYAVEHFTNTDIDNARIDPIVRNLRQSIQNIVLIGMPSAGKTTLGNALSRQLKIPFVDIDHAIERTMRLTVAQCFQKFGEEGFRDFESEACIKYGAIHHQVIATGGGCVLRKENMDALRSNGIIIWIRRPLDMLISDKTRPLSSSPAAIEKLYQARSMFYRQYADFTLDNDGDLLDGLNKCYTWLESLNK